MGQELVCHAARLCGGDPGLVHGSEFSERVRIRTYRQNWVRIKSEFGLKVRIMDFLSEITKEFFYLSSATVEITCHCTDAAVCQI